jgi:hypothetical protein
MHGPAIGLSESRTGGIPSRRTVSPVRHVPFQRDTSLTAFDVSVVGITSSRRFSFQASSSWPWARGRSLP